MQGQTLTGEVTQASMVLYGTLTNADETKETTDLVIDTVIKDHKARNDRKTLKLNRYVPPANDGKTRYLVFCDVFQGKIDPYRGLAVKKDCNMGAYLKGALEVKDAKVGKRLRFFFDYLDNPDLEISNDAYKEFANADYKDYRDMAKTLPADRVARWLRDPNTPGFRFGLYASMLGHCGTDKDAKLLLSLLEDPARRAGSGVDGILAGYTMLKPREGWKYVRGILEDPKKEFMLRYAALRAARFLWDSRPDLVGKKELAQGVAQLLGQSDIADLAVEDLRKWQCWDMADQVLGLRKTPAYEIPIVRRSVLRFALSCKGNAAAARYVEEQRKKDAQAVSDAEELLKLEQTPPPVTPPK
jgi:hypothetical protein